MQEKLYHDYLAGRHTPRLVLVTVFNVTDCAKTDSVKEHGSPGASGKNNVKTQRLRWFRLSLLREAIPFFDTIGRFSEAGLLE